MGFLDAMVGQVGEALSQPQGQSGQGGVMELVSHLVSNPQTGGLQGLLKSFQEKGLGEAVSSWVGTGQNLPVSADQIQQVLGSGPMKDLAAKFGLTPEAASSGLASMLPQLVDKLTPNGQLPEHNQLVEQGLSLLKGKLFG